MGYLDKARRVHFVGIGGIGMSSLAFILLERGYAISGSDVKSTPLIRRIIANGGKVFYGHKESNLARGAELVVYSSSIAEDNPELCKAKTRGVPIAHRSDIAAEMVNCKLGIAITGAHGKTTTTAMSAMLLTMAGLDPTVIVGGEVAFFNGNWRSGKGDFVVCEADESDGTFLKLRPKYAILTNMDREHLDYYKNLEGVIRANKIFIEGIKSGGRLITSLDDLNIRRMLKGYKKAFRTYSIFEKEADLYSKAIRMEGLSTAFEAVYKGKRLGAFELNIPGRHNVGNSLSVILLGLELGIDVKTIKKALFEYKGAARRFQIKGEVGDVMVVEDYAHHPKEISATISACKNLRDRRIVGVFQPHRFTRTKFLKKEFGRSFLDLDELVLTDIYSASEDPIKGISSRVIYDEAVKNGQRRIQLLKKKEIVPYLLNTVRRRDIVLILGAGDIGEVSDELVKGLKDKRQYLV